MTALKLLFFLCITVFFTYAQVPEMSCHLKLKFVKSEAITLLKQLSQSHMQAAQLVIPKIGELLELIDIAAEVAIEVSKKHLEADIEPFVEEIEELQNKAAEVGILGDNIITECIGTRIQDMYALPAQILSKVTLCVEHRVTALKKYVNESLEKIYSTVGVEEDFADQIDIICSNKFLLQQEQCFTEVSANITEKIKTLPLQIINDGATINRFVLPAVQEMGKCGAGMSDDLYNAGDRIVGNITACAIEKGKEELVELLD